LPFPSPTLYRVVSVRWAFGRVAWEAPPETRMKPAGSKRKRSLKAHADEIRARLAAEYPNAKCALRHTNALELLVATILSAQCTDTRVNEVTKMLFKKYPTARHYAEAPLGQLEEDVRATGFYRNKAKSLSGMAQKLVEEHGGKVPGTMDALIALPGVGRKTANVVLGNAFGVNDGIVVDTHVTRLAGRLKLTRHKNNQGDRIEKDLMELLPREDWTVFAHLLVLHGRNVCTARKPDCPACPIRKFCPSAFKV